MAGTFIRFICFAQIAGLTLVAHSQAFAQDRLKFLLQEYNLRFEGDRPVWDRLVSSINSNGFTVAAIAVATRFGVPPGQIATAIGIARTVFSSRDKGEEHIGTMPAPDGYTICSVELVRAEFTWARRHDVTFNSRVERTCQGRREDGSYGADNVGYYIVTPKATSGTAVDARMRVTFVLADPSEVVRLTRAGQCMAHNTCAWVCRNGDCTYDLANCEPSDKWVDRWLAGHWDQCERYNR